MADVTSLAHMDRDLPPVAKAFPAQPTDRAANGHRGEQVAGEAGLSSDRDDRGVERARAQADTEHRHDRQHEASMGERTQQCARREIEHDNLNAVNARGGRVRMFTKRPSIAGLEVQHPERDQQDQGHDGGYGEGAQTAKPIAEEKEHGLRATRRPSWYARLWALAVGSAAWVREGATSAGMPRSLRLPARAGRRRRRSPGRTPLLRG